MVHALDTYKAITSDNTYNLASISGILGEKKKKIEIKHCRSIRI